MSDSNFINKQAHEHSYKGSKGSVFYFFEALYNAQGKNSYQAITSELNDLNSPVILDAGMGTGNLIRYLDPAWPLENFFGIDISENALTRAKNIFPSCADRFLNASLVTLPFEDNFFDVVFSHMVLALVSPIEKSLHEISRILKPGGMLRIFTPAYWRLEDGKESLKFKECMDFLASIAPNPDEVGIGNVEFRHKNLILAELTKAFGSDVEVNFKNSDFIIEQKSVEVIQIFSVGMYQFMLIPDEMKGQALKDMFNKILSVADKDGVVRMRRPMELITVWKPL